MHDDEAGHEQQPPGAVQRDDHAEEHERDVLSIRCWKLAWMNGEVRIPQKWPMLRAWIPSPSSWLESIELIASTSHISRDDRGEQHQALALLAAVGRRAVVPRRSAELLGHSASMAARATARATAMRSAERRQVHELLGRVRAATARAEPVDRERDRAARSGWRRWRHRGRAARSGARAARRRRASSGAAAASESIAGQTRSSTGSSVDAADLGRDRRQHVGEGARCRSSACRRPARRTGGTTLIASPERTIVGTTVRRGRAVGVGDRRTLDRGVRERQQRVAALLRRRARVRGPPGGAHAHRAGALAPDDHAVLAGLADLAGLEAEARVVAGEALGVARTARSATPRRRPAAPRARRSARRRSAQARATASDSATPPFMSAVPEP